MLEPEWKFRTKRANMGSPAALVDLASHSKPEHRHLTPAGCLSALHTWSVCWLQALLGKAHCLQLLGAPAAALELINAVIAQQPWFLSALVEKANLLVSMHEWEQGMEVLGQVLQQEPDNIQALRLSGTHLNLLLVIVWMRQVRTN